MADTFRILTLNSISSVGLKRLSADRYTVGGRIENPDAILVRSHDMHAMEIGQAVKAIGRVKGVAFKKVPGGRLGGTKLPYYSAVYRLPDPGEAGRAKRARLKFR